MSGYLVYDSAGMPGGLMHLFGNLTQLVREAALLGRTLVVPPPNLDSSLSGGYSPPPVWSRYADLENSLLEIKYKNGESEIRRFPVLSQDDFRSLKIPDKECLHLSGESPVSDEQNRRHRVISKTLAFADKMNRDIIPMGNYYENARVAGIEVGFKPSELVESLARPVLQALGEEYAAVHFRTYGYSRAFSCLDSRVTGLFMKDIKRLIPRGTPLYFMTNHLDGNYSGHLEKHFTVFTYRRFPELRRLMSQCQPDNYLLAQVEYCIFAHAAIRLCTKESFKHTPITRYLIIAGQKPDSGIPVNLIEASRNLFVRILKCSDRL